MKQFHHVTITVFVRGDEIEFLDALLPISTQEFLKTQFTYDQNHHNTKLYALKHAELSFTWSDESNLNVYKFFFTKQTDTNAIFEKIISSLSKEEYVTLKSNALKQVDNEGNFFLRLDKTALMSGKYALTTSGNCVHLIFSLATYPKNEQTIHEGVKKLFSL